MLSGLPSAAQSGLHSTAAAPGKLAPQIILASIQTKCPKVLMYPASAMTCRRAIAWVFGAWLFVASMPANQTKHTTTFDFNFVQIQKALSCFKAET